MRSYICIITVITLFWTGIWGSATWADHVRPGQVHLQLTTVPEFKPFVWQENGVARGIDIEIVQEICRRMDMVCDINFHPWKRVLLDIESGRSHGGFAGFRTKERERFARFMTFPLHHSTYNLFVKKGQEFEFSKIENLHGKTIGIQRGFNLSSVLDAAVIQGRIKIQEVDSMEQNIKKLMAGNRIDAVAANYHKMKLTLRRKGIQSQITCLPIPITPPRPSYLMISQKWSTPHDLEDLIQDLDQTLKSMYDAGFIDLINSKYLD